MTSRTLANCPTLQPDLSEKPEEKSYYDRMLVKLLSGCLEPLTRAERYELAQFEADQRDAAVARAKAKADKERLDRPVYKLPPGFSMLMPALLRSGVFSTARVKTKPVDKSFPVPRHDSIDDYKGGSVSYRGPQLGQFHKRVVLGLIERASAVGELEVTFHAQEFLVALGHSAESDSVATLARVLEHLMDGTFGIHSFDGDRRCFFKIVYEVEWTKRMCKVKLNKRVADALKPGLVTYIPMCVRKGLTDGLQTALLDLLYATEQTTFAINDLATLWGRTAGLTSVRELARELVPALERLVEVGAIESFERTYGKVKVARLGKFPPREA